MNVISPTKKVHAVETQHADGTVTVECHMSIWYNMCVEWPETDKSVTCKNCLAEIEKEFMESLK